MAIELQHVSKSYGKDFALKDVTLTMEIGKIYGVVGPNGSGKSTTLKMIAGLVFPNNGEIHIDETKITRQSSEKVAYLKERDRLYRTFQEEKMVALYASQLQDFDIEKTKQLLKDMKIDPTKKIKQLSKGNRGRLKLVLTLARKAPVLLLDEPFSGLDPMVRESIVKSLISYINFDKQTVIIATHEIDVIEPLLDEVVVILQGNIIKQKNVEDLREKEGLSVLQWFKSTMGQVEHHGGIS